jgi:hypothetical protein
MRTTIIIGILLTAGCATHTYAPLASHTLEQGQADVVWALEDGIRVVRCTNTNGDRPVCVRADVR